MGVILDLMAVGLCFEEIFFLKKNAIIPLEAANMGIPLNCSKEIIKFDGKLIK